MDMRCRNIGRDILRLGLGYRQRRERPVAFALSPVGGPLQQVGMNVEDVARIGFASRRPAEKQRQLPIGVCVASKIIVDDENVASVVHEVLRDAGGGVGGHVLKPRCVIASGHHNHAVVERVVLTQIGYHLGHG